MSHIKGECVSVCDLSPASSPNGRMSGMSMTFQLLPKSYTILHSTSKLAITGTLREFIPEAWVGMKWVQKKQPSKDQPLCANSYWNGKKKEKKEKQNKQMWDVAVTSQVFPCTSVL